MAEQRWATIALGRFVNSLRHRVTIFLLPSVYVCTPVPALWYNQNLSLSQASQAGKGLRSGASLRIEPPRPSIGAIL
ncbi:MAG: hypothetical protein ACOYME_13005 [Prochlorotrichaceae cyanobacterium]